MEPGSVVEYIEDRVYKVAVCVVDRGNRVQVLNESGREVNLGLARVLYSGGRRLNLKEPRHKIEESLRGISAHRKEIQSKIDLTEIWELVAEEDGSYDPAFLSEIVFGEGSDADHEAAFIRAVIDERTRFKFKDGRIYPLSAEKVAQVLEQREAERRREEELDRESSWLKGAFEQGGPPPDLEEHANLIESLKAAALGDPVHPLFKMGEALLKRAELGGKERAFDVLVRLGLWSPDQNLDLERLQVPVEFAPGVLDDVDRLVEWPLPGENKHEDLTHLPAITIDSLSTSDFDDALSIIRKGDGYEFGIHIADVSAYVFPESPLDDCGKERGTSIYMPDGRIAMLPSEISDRLCSLREGMDRPALSLLVDLNEELDVRGYRFVSSVIRVKRRMTYSEVDLIHDRDEDMVVLSKIAGKLLRRRIEAGAIPQPPFEVSVTVEPDGSVGLKRIERDSISRLIVSESMIFANCLAAEFLHASEVPGFFRAQAEPKERVEGDLEKDLFAMYRQRRQLQPLVLQTQKSPHSSLGVSAYTNMTSPIRRYMDLVVQRQLLSVIKGSPPPYSEGRLKEMLMEIEPVVKRANLLKNRRYRYWMLKYFKKLRGQGMQALVLEKHPRSYRILLTDTLFECNLPIVSSVALKPGEHVQVRVDRSNPRDDILKVSLG